MKLKIENNWEIVKKDFVACQKSSMGLVQIASVDSEGIPNMTPIGSMFLNDDKTAFFCNRFPENLNRNLKTNDKICVIAMKSSKWFWMKSLFKGRFATCPGIKLFGRVRAKRKIKKDERAQWQRVVKPFRFLKGYHLLWKDMSHASDIVFEDYEYLKAGKMTQNQITR